MFESEFFGHVRGAFTGAVRDRIGRFELADGGTLFLDEVGEIPLELQGKLLRVLQEGNFERVGEERTRTVDVRLIAATNRDLKQEVQRGRFREDLYFRLNVFPVESVPLRERREDIPLLAQHFLMSESKELKSDLRLSEGDARRLSRYDWPGNVRELQNVIERAAILAQNGRLRIDLPDTPGAQSPSGAGRQKAEPRPAVMTSAEMRDHERANILAALQACNGKVFGAGGAAAMLDLKPTTLASRMKALGIAPARSRQAPFPDRMTASRIVIPLHLLFEHDLSENRSTFPDHAPGRTPRGSGCEPGTTSAAYFPRCLSKKPAISSNASFASGAVSSRPRRRATGLRRPAGRLDAGLAQLAMHAHRVAEQQVARAGGEDGRRKAACRRRPASKAGP